MPPPLEPRTGEVAHPAPTTALAEPPSFAARIFPERRRPRLPLTSRQWGDHEIESDNTTERRRDDARRGSDTGAGRPRGDPRREPGANAAERGPRRRDRPRDRGRTGIPVRRDRRRLATDRRTPRTPAHERLPRRRAHDPRMDRRRLPVRPGHPDHHRLDHRPGRALHRAPVRGAVPGHPERRLRRIRGPRGRHDVPVRQRRLLELGELRGHRRRGAPRHRDADVVRHLERTRHRDLLDARRQQRAVLPDVGHRRPRDPPRRSERGRPRAVVRLHARAPPAAVADLAGAHQDRRHPPRLDRQPHPGRDRRSGQRRPVHARRPGGQRHPAAPDDRQRVPARGHADHQRPRLVPRPLRPIRLHQRLARQLVLLPDPEPHGPAHRQRAANRPVVDDAGVRGDDRDAGIHLGAGRRHRDLGVQGQHRGAGRRHHRRHQRPHRSDHSRLRRAVVDAVAGRGRHGPRHRSAHARAGAAERPAGRVRAGRGRLERLDLGAGELPAAE